MRSTYDRCIVERISKCVADAGVQQEVSRRLAERRRRAVVTSCWHTTLWLLLRHIKGITVYGNVHTIHLKVSSLHTGGARAPHARAAADRTGLHNTHFQDFCPRTNMGSLAQVHISDATGFKSYVAAKQSKKKQGGPSSAPSSQNRKPSHPASPATPVSHASPPSSHDRQTQPTTRTITPRPAPAPPARRPRRPGRPPWRRSPCRGPRASGRGAPRRPRAPPPRGRPTGCAQPGRVRRARGHPRGLGGGWWLVVEIERFVLAPVQPEESLRPRPLSHAHSRPVRPPPGTA
jgi:hypothetical protein